MCLLVFIIQAAGHSVVVHYPKWLLSLQTGREDIVPYCTHTQCFKHLCTIKIEISYTHEVKSSAMLLKFNFMHVANIYLLVIMYRLFKHFKKHSVFHLHNPVWLCHHSNQYRYTVTQIPFQLLWNKCY